LQDSLSLHGQLVWIARPQADDSYFLFHLASPLGVITFTGVRTQVRPAGVHLHSNSQILKH
jgi:hypothetical protein